MKHSHKRYLPYLLCMAGVSASLLSGCTGFKQVTVMKGQRFYAYTGLTTVAPTLYGYSNAAPFHATFREEGNAVFITTTGTPTLVSGIVTPPATTAYGIDEARKVAAPIYFYSTKEAGFEPPPTGSGRTRFGYRQYRPYLQAMAIPLKFRGAVGNNKSQVETGPTFALAPGIKHSWNWYKGTKNTLGYNTTSLSVSVGGLIGLGVVDITDKNTQGQVTTLETSKNAIIPVGGHIVFGLHPINIGFAVGQDIVTGRNADKWDYQGKWWTGIIVGLDLIK